MTYICQEKSFAFAMYKKLSEQYFSVKAENHNIIEYHLTFKKCVF